MSSSNKNGQHTEAMNIKSHDQDTSSLTTNN